MFYVGAFTSGLGLFCSGLNLSIFGLTILVFAGLLNIADAIENSKKNT